MAVTIYDKPQYLSPAGNPLMFTFSSNQTAQENFSFIVEVYVNSVLHSTHQVFRQSETMSKFDCSGILQSTLQSPLIVDGTLATFYDAAINPYYIKVYEKYGATPTIHASATSSGRFAFNGSLRHQDFINWNYLEHSVSTTNSLPTTSILWLTDWPRARRYFLSDDERLFFGILNSDIGICQLRVRLYNSSGTQIVTNITNVALANLLVLDVSPSTIIANMAITQANFDAAAYYTIQARAQGAGAYSGGSEVFRIDLDRECKRYETKRLHWLNKYGVWDSFTFSLVSVDSTSVQSQGYQREKGVWDGTSYTYPMYQGERVDYAKRASDQLLLNSDWIYESVQQWLVRGLYESPIVYLEVENGTAFEPVKVVNQGYEFKTRRRNGLIQEQVSIERTYTYTSQLN